MDPTTELWSGKAKYVELMSTVKLGWSRSNFVQLWSDHFKIIAKTGSRALTKQLQISNDNAVRTILFKGKV